MQAAVRPHNAKATTYGLLHAIPSGRPMEAYRRAKASEIGLAFAYASWA